MDELHSVVAASGWALAPDSRSSLEDWAWLVAEWRERAGLTAARTPAGVVHSLMVPAAYALALLPVEADRTIIDLGCGSGATGALLASVVGRGRWLLVDRSEKKVIFCRYALARCRIGDVEALTLEECLSAGEMGDAALVRGLPRSKATESTLRRIVRCSGTVIRWVPGGQAPTSGPAVRCGRLALWVVAEPVRCFT
jgi:16S rRNA G527 N7-methylase RsmG